MSNYIEYRLGNLFNIIKKNIHWVLRLAISSTFFIHGYPKLGSEVANLGMIGYLVGPFEFFGALFIIVGPFTKDILTRIGSFMLVIIMLGAIYMHLYKWGDTIADIEWQILLLAVSLFFVFKGDDI
jgi:uncharacterized membrane protein YphA (DoxX/SURF4 family)